MFGFQTKISSLRVVKARQRQTYRSMMRKTSRSCSFAQSSWKDLHLRTSRSISTTFSSVSAYPVLHYVNFEDCQILSLRVPRGATHTCHYHKTCELFLTYTHFDVRNWKCAFKMSCVPLDHNVEVHWPDFCAWRYVATRRDMHKTMQSSSCMHVLRI